VPENILNLFQAIVLRALFDIKNYTGPYTPKPTKNRQDRKDEIRKQYASMLAKHNFNESRYFFRKNGGYQQWLILRGT
jgi:hypothetical protein